MDMSYVIAAPEIMTAAAAGFGQSSVRCSTRRTRRRRPRPLALAPAAADEVSVGIAHLFSRHAEDYQALAGKAAAFQEQFVQHLTAGAGSCAAAEAANTALLQPLAASAGSIGSAIGDFWDQLVNSVNAAVGQLGNLLTGFQNMLNSFLTNLELTLLVLSIPVGLFLISFIGGVILFPFLFPLVFLALNPQLLASLNL